MAVLVKAYSPCVPQRQGRVPIRDITLNPTTIYPSCPDTGRKLSIGMDIDGECVRCGGYDKRTFPIAAISTLIDAQRMSARGRTARMPHT